MHPVIETHSGRRVNFNLPEPAQITFGDIAWSLSRTPRYNGHTQGKHPYSVAQHSVWVAFIAQHFLHATRITTLQALLHDAHEAYTGDIVSPLKYLPDIAALIKPIELKIQRAVHKAFCLPEPDSVGESIIALADNYALTVEAHHLMYSNGKDWPRINDFPEELFSLFWEPLPAKKADELFWVAKNYIDQGYLLEDLWRSI